jgi:hypothetical protein
MRPKIKDQRPKIKDKRRGTRRKYNMDPLREGGWDGSF